MASDMKSKKAFKLTGSNATREMTAEERCVASLPCGTKCRVEMYNVVLDRSASIGDSNLESLFSKGLPAMVKRIQSNNKDRNKIALVRIVAFGSDVEVLLDWTNVASASEKIEYIVMPKASGVTRLDLAIRDGLDAIDRMKAAIDAAIDSYDSEIQRGGAVNLIITDGCLTDDHGNEIPVPEDLSIEISERQSSHATSFILLGIGQSVSGAQLARLAPPTITRSGVKIAHAAMYKHSILFDDSEDEEHFWVMVSQLIADASSGSSTPGFNEAFMSLDEFEIVGA